MKRMLLTAGLLLGAMFARAEMWLGLDEANHCCGVRASEAGLLGKVVFVYQWNASVPESVQMLEQVQKYWDSFRGKPFVVLGSHSGGVAAAKAAGSKVTFPNYEGVALASGAPNGNIFPHYYVVNHRGRIIYSGLSDREAIEAAENAFFAVNGPATLTGAHVFSKKSPYRSMEKQLVLGKSIKSQVAKLEGDVKKAGTKTATKVQIANAEEARAILREIEAAKSDCRQEIDIQKKVNPEKALKLIKDYMVTFPEEGAAYKDELPELTERAKEFKEKMKAKAAEAKAAKAKK